MVRLQKHIPKKTGTLLLLYEQIFFRGCSTRHGHTHAETAAVSCSLIRSLSLPALSASASSAVSPADSNAVPATSTAPPQSDQYRGLISL